MKFDPSQAPHFLAAGVHALSVAQDRKPAKAREVAGGVLPVDADARKLWRYCQCAEEHIQRGVGVSVFVVDDCGRIKVLQVCERREEGDIFRRGLKWRRHAVSAALIWHGQDTYETGFCGAPGIGFPGRGLKREAFQLGDRSRDRF